MKKLFIRRKALLIIIITIINFINIIPAVAQEATDSSKAAQIKELKSLLATRVAELRTGTKKVVAGEIKTITSDDKIILTAKSGEVTVVPTDNAVFLRVSLTGKKTVSLANFVAKDHLIAFGSQDQISGTLNAGVLIAQIVPTLINGFVTEIDRPNGTLTLKTSKNGSYIIDIEVNTKIYTPDQKRYGYSKMKVNDHIFVAGVTPTTVTNGENRLSAIRILDFPTTAMPTPSPTSAATSSTKQK